MSATKGNRTFLRSPLLWVMGALFVISAIWFGHLYHRGVDKDSLEMEFAKALLQVGVVSVAGTLLSVLVFNHQREAANRKDAVLVTEKRLQARDEILKGTISRVTHVFGATKRARRTVRALGLRRMAEGALVRLERYDGCLADVNDAQLELEAIKSDVKTSGPLYPSSQQLTSALRDMEQYLGALIEEYETVRAGLSDGTAEFPLERVPRFADFVGTTKGSEFATKFSGGHDQARASIRSDLLRSS